MEIQWEEPPQVATQGLGEAQEFLAELRANPGRWARFRAYKKTGTAANCAQQINKGSPKYLAGCEAVSRKVGDEGVVFIRWPEGKP